MLYHNKVSNKWLYSCEPACLKKYLLIHHNNSGVPSQYSFVEWHKGCCGLLGEIFILDICFKKWSKNLKLSTLPGNISKWHCVKWKLIQAEFKLGFIAQSCLAPGFRWAFHFLFYVIDEKPRACFFAALWCQTCLQWGQIFPVLRWNSGRMNICRLSHY